MAPQRIESTKEETLMAFVASCTEWLAHETGADYLSVFNRMESIGLIENYILKYYEVLHLESRKNIVQDILETLSLWENEKISHGDE